MEIVRSRLIDYSDYHYTRNITITYLIKCIFQSQYMLAFIGGLKQHKTKRPHTNRKPQATFHWLGVRLPWQSTTFTREKLRDFEKGHVLFDWSANKSIKLAAVV